MSIGKRGRLGQGSNEYALLLSVIVIAVVAASYLFGPTAMKAVEHLGHMAGFGYIDWSKPMDWRPDTSASGAPGAAPRG